MKITRSLAAFTTLLTLAIAAPPATAGASNDTWAQRVVIPVPSLAGGFNHTQPDVSGATTEASDPILTCKNGDPSQRGNTLWYSLDLTGQNVPAFVNGTAAGYDSVLAVFTGAPGSFVPVAGGCNDDGAPSFSAALHGFRLDAGSVYSIMVARPAQSTNPATLIFSMRAAPQYVVTKTADTLDGACDADCSLREAIGASNGAPGAVLLPVGEYILSRTGAANENSNASGDLDATVGFGLYGAGIGSRVRGLSGERVLDLEPANPTNIGSTFNIAEVAISNGSGIGPGAGINANNGNDHLALRRILLEDNQSTLLPGGGVNSRGPTVVDGSVVRNNSSAGNGGGLALAGDSVLIRVDLLGSTISGNQSLSTSSGGGGGVYGSTNVFVYNSTLSGNRARFNGGGLLSTTFNGRLTLLNVTIANNQSDSDLNGSGVGGGLRVEGNAASSYNSVFSVNSAGAGADDCSKSPGLNITPAVMNHADVATVGSDCSFGAGNSVGVPALLGPLANHGGTGQTHRPQPGSPLIDSGSNADCLASDQRGILRPQDGDLNGTSICDKGAVELNGAEADFVFRNGFE